MIGGRISVVMPVHNAERWIGEAIESVLIQGDDLLEIVVVDDGSTDGSAAIADDFGPPVRVLRQLNRGLPAAQNRGLAVAKGEYITFLDADDLYSPDKFSLQAGRLDRHPTVDVVIGQLSYLRHDGTDGREPLFAEQRDDHLSLSFGASLFRRRAFDRIGVMDEAMRYCQDWDWFMRAREAEVPLRIHRHVVLRQRLHEGNMTRQREANARFTLETMRRSLTRRRGLGVPTSLPPLASFLEPLDAQA